MSFRYTVKATFRDQDLVDEWLLWLVDGHCQEVCEGGAEGAEIVAMEGEALSFEVRYDFPDRATFERYEAEHAPRLRAEGLERFPTSRGISYARTSGEVLAQVGGGGERP